MNNEDLRAVIIGIVAGVALIPTIVSLLDHNNWLGAIFGDIGNNNYNDNFFPDLISL
jgi:hypothetical protein